MIKKMAVIKIVIAVVILWGGAAEVVSSDLESIRQAAAQGDAEAQYQLGDIYYYGEGVSKNYTRAVEWYRKSANQGNAIAQNNLRNIKQKISR